MDPQNGEISRAMRNRSVEIYVSEEQQWYKHPLDVATVMSSPTKHVPLEVSKALCSLSAEKQLHFGALLSELSVPEACRMFGLKNIDSMVDTQNITFAPFEREIGTESYDLWLAKIWKECSGTDTSCALLLALLSTSTAALRNNLFQRVFGDNGE
ncbi:unnamed protein product [Strongylus vulgaris]|uniref:Uncharacterized protein n=1 Tax=Strongylus vulgaris TaxID=40348 RepID=A0A3P7L350_STRVU|nr:unnamed protein product [Strongylus vulgaris]